MSEAVPQAQRGSWSSFIKQLAGFTGDISSLSAPPFILSTTSLTEFPAYWCERPELFSEISDGTNPQDRALRVLKWFIATLKGQYTSRNEKLGSEKKPFNPVLGELFYGNWPDNTQNRGETNLVVEQVSHHPPITAYYINNPTKKISLQGHSGQKTSFSTGAIIVKQVGHATLSLTLPDGNVETYLITLPRLRIDGIVYGSPYIELTDTSYIASSTGWLSTLEYKGKGYFTGKSHVVKATLAGPDGAIHETIDGLWHEITKTQGGKGDVFTDVRGPKEEVTVKPIEEQGEWESRKLWQKVADGIRVGDFDTASREKIRIENEQRQRRKDEQAAGTKWPLKHFERIENDPLYEEMAKKYNWTPQTEEVYVFKA